jgi:energy-coupling factor transporter ATP-binding protein EcfA2
MKIKFVHIQDFKRFSVLQIVDLPETAKLVVLLGPNGSGKTSLFEAFNLMSSLKTRGLDATQKSYYWKMGSPIKDHYFIQIKFYGASQEMDLIDLPDEQYRKSFYFRSAYRHEATFDNKTVLPSVSDALLDQRRPWQLMLSEARVSDNYQRVIASAIAELFNVENRSSATEIRDRIIGRIRTSMKNIFEDLVLNGTGDPIQDKNFLFDKGKSHNYPYKNLSGGEKAAFDLILDFVIKSEVFDDTVFCIDEPELHMHTRLQAKLLDELYRHIQPNCQLWIATHAIGMIRRAMELQRLHPDEVVFLDFEGHNFDESVVMRPAKVDRQLWKRVFAVALDDLSELVAPSQIIFCEGRPHNEGGKKKSFDTEIYKAIFSSTHPETEFIPLGGTTQIDANAVTLSSIFKTMFSPVKMWSVIDRDDRSEREIEKAKLEGKRVLSRRDLENYLWDDEILQKLCEVNGQSDKLQEILALKTTLLNEAIQAQKPKDDIKAISGRLYVEIKRVLSLTACGNTKDAFCIDTLAPLITRETQVYQELEHDIFGT